MKGKRRFFSRHAKSSAALASLGIHAVLVLVGISLVVITVNIDKDPGFVVTEFRRPNMPPRKIQLPVKIKKRKARTPKIREQIVCKSPRTNVEIQMPPVSVIDCGLGTLNVPKGLGEEIGVTIPDITFFKLKKKSEKVVFVVLAGPASTTGSNGYQSPKSRMCFHTLRARLNDMVANLPDYALFNATFFMANMTTPFSTNMVLATQENKDLLAEWAAPVNPLELEQTYSPGSVYEGFWDRFIALDWDEGERWEGADVPPVYPKWLYRYNPGPHIQKYYFQGYRDEREFVHVNRAICFALEQKPDAIFVLTTNYIGVDPAMNALSYMNICRELYGPDRRDYPSINVVVMARPGRSVDGASATLGKYMPIINAFRGEGAIIEDIRDHMTPEERAAMNAMAGTF
jgi:hypothetical protein